MRIGKNGHKPYKEAVVAKRNRMQARKKKSLKLYKNKQIV